MTSASQSIQASFATDGTDLSDLESNFAEVLLWYDGFNDSEKLKLLRYDSDDQAIIFTKMADARASGDYKTSDHLREVLRRAGIDVRNKK